MPLTDKGYQGAEIGILVPFKGTNLNADARDQEHDGQRARRSGRAR